MSEDAPVVKPVWIVAFTGHRPLVGEPGRSREEIDACRESLKEVLQSLIQKANEYGGHCELLCSVADGADLLAIEVAEQLKMPVHLNLPLPPQEFKRDFLDASGELLEAWRAVDRYITRSRDPKTQWTFRVALGDGIRPGCYHDTNLQMLEVADVLIAIHSGTESTRLGGTSEVLLMADAEHLKIPTIVLDSTQRGTVTRRDSWEPGGADEELLERLNIDMASPEAQDSQSVSQRTGEGAVWAVHQALDNVANSTSQTFRGSLELSTKLHFTATVLATITAAFAKVIYWDLAPILLTVGELLLVAYAFGLFLYYSWIKANPRWRRSRLAAEISDSQIQTAGLVDPLQPLVVRHNEDWKRFALAVALDAHRQKESQLSDLDQEQRRVQLTTMYLENRIAGQLRYFRDQAKMSTDKLHRWHLIAKVATYLATPVVLVALIIKCWAHWDDLHGQGTDWVKSIFVFALPILVPLIASLASTMIVVGDAARRSTRYKQVVQRLEKYAQLVPSLGTTSATQRVVLELEDILLDEMIEWNATAGNMGH